MAGRPPLKVGHHGNISYTNIRPRQVQATCYVRDPDGVRREVTAQGTSKPAARANLLDKISDRLGIGGEITAETKLVEVAQLWLAEVERKVADGQLAPNTLRVYRSALTNHVEPGVGQLRVREATPAALDRFITTLRANNATDIVKTSRSVLSGIMGFAVRRGALGVNPVREVGRIHRGRKSAARALTAAERTAWLTAMDADIVACRHDLPDLTRMLLATGVRIAECLALDFKDLEPNPGLVAVDWQITRITGKGLVRGPTKSEAGERTLRLPRWGVEIVKRRGDTRNWTGPLFPDAKGGWRDPSNTSRVFREARERAGFGWITSHNFRKTVATILDEAGLSAREIADQLGHAKVSMTQDVYLGRHAVGEAAAAALDDIFDEVPGISAE